MEKDSGRREKTAETAYRWSGGRKRYMCADMADVRVASRVFK